MYAKNNNNKTPNHSCSNVNDDFIASVQKLVNVPRVSENSEANPQIAGPSNHTLIIQTSKQS